MKKLTLMLAVLMLAIPLTAMAGPRGPGGPPPAVMKKVMRDVGLTDAQIKQVEELHFKAEREALDIRHEVQKARLDLQQLMAAAQPDQGTVFAQLDKIGALQTKLKKNRVGVMLQIRKLMTPEQWDKLEAIQAEHRMQRKGGKRGRLGGPGAGPGGPGGGPGGPAF